MYSINFELPDLVRATVWGDVSAQEADEMVAFLDKHVAGLPYVLWMADVRGMRWLPGNVRRIAAEKAKKLPFHGYVLIGANGTAINTCAASMIE